MILGIGILILGIGLLCVVGSLIVFFFFVIYFSIDWVVNNVRDKREARSRRKKAASVPDAVHHVRD